jgi:4-amino-4-deoxy-L-arabinose transferase-like glycosyltransferase
MTVLRSTLFGTPWRSAVTLVGITTLVRIVVLFASQLQLYPDEAQYWVWSRHLAFGYFSKPPMIAWLIRATTFVGGDGEAWIRLSAPLLHGGAALALFQAGRRLYGEHAGFWAAVLYTLMPGVQLSSAIVATDGPLMLFLSLAVWAYAAFSTEADLSLRRRAALALGAALGAAFLTKYAAFYIAGGVLLHAIFSRQARARWDFTAVALCIGAALALAAPNLAWNATHHFQTVAHTAENADFGGDGGVKGLFGPRGPFGFLLGQFGVFGPVPFGVLAAVAWMAVRGRATPEDRLLLTLAAPALAVVFAEAVVARANANWAGAAYAPGAVLAAGLMSRWRARGWLTAMVASQGFIAIGFILGVTVPGLANAVGAGNAFKRARGWREDTQAIVAVARSAQAEAPLTAVAVDDRFLFNALSYYGRDDAGRPAAALPAPLKAWVHLARPANQAEAETPLTAADGARVLAISADDTYRPAFEADFARATPAQPATINVALDPKHKRRLDLFIGQGFTPRPRDPVTGRPIPR